jgi:uncharacterized protein (TIGR03435 family)
MNILACGSLTAIAMLFTAATILGQPTARLTFEVASIKPTTLNPATIEALNAAGKPPKMGRSVSGTRVNYDYMSMRELIAEAYQVKYHQVVGPDWLNSVRFDIAARMPAPASGDDSPIMLQRLLEERFKLSVHRQSKEQSVLALTVAKRGPKLKEFAPPEAGAGEKSGSGPDGGGKAGKSVFTFDPATESWHFESDAILMADFADMLTATSKMGGGDGRTIVDMTGLKGQYHVAVDIPLAAMRKMALATGVASGEEDGAGTPASAASDPNGLSLNQSLQNLGLRLELQKAPVAQLVVDRAERTPVED